MKNKAITSLVAVATGIFMMAAGQAQAAVGISIVVTPWAAPNIFGSSSFDGAAANQFNALYTGASSSGTAGTPTYYQGITGPVAYGANIATNFNSWMGVADPGAPYQNELGNRIQYGVRIDGNGTQFSISQLSFILDGDGSDIFDYDFSTGYQYAAYGAGGGYVGILKGSDGQIGTSDDVFITSGADTQLVDALIGRGSGNADAVYCGPVPDTSGPCGAGNQGYLNAEVAALQADGFTQLKGTYSLVGTSATGSATVHFTAGVPEPTTWMMMILGFGLIGGAVRRRRGDGVAVPA